MTESTESEVRPIEELVAAVATADVARALTSEIRDAIRAVRIAAARLCALVRQAHGARVWIALGYASWEQYAGQEFGIGRSHAYRLLDQAVTAEELTGAMVARGLLSPAGDSGAVIDQLSGRDWRSLKGRADQVADLIAAGASQLPAPMTEAVLRELVVQAVRQVRGAGKPAVADSHTDMEAALERLLAATSEVGEDSPERMEREFELMRAWNRARNRRIGELALRLAPEYLSDDEAYLRVMPMVEASGETPEYVLACRRYMQTGDERALPSDIEDEDLVETTAA